MKFRRSRTTTFPRFIGHVVAMDVKSEVGGALWVVNKQGLLLTHRFFKRTLFFKLSTTYTIAGELHICPLHLSAPSVI
jgi:hypothetical protein